MCSDAGTTRAGVRCGQASNGVRTNDSAKVASPRCPPANHPPPIAVNRDALLSFSGAIDPMLGMESPGAPVRLFGLALRVS